MGSLVGHVAPGFGFFVIGLWHLFNHTKLYSLDDPKYSYTSSPWFPTSFLRYLELYLIMGGSIISIGMELFIGPKRHQPFDPDGTIPSNHLQNFEHSSISMYFFIYASFAILLDKIQPKAHQGLTQLLAAMGFGQQLLVFHFHSADHMGVEGHYHLLLQIVILVSLITTLIGINDPNSFLISFVRSTSILFQGVWLMVMGFMLWTPELIPKGCSINFEQGHYVVRCDGDHALDRAKSLVNLQFSWFLAAISIFAMLFYVVMVRFYAKKVEYWPMTKVVDDEEEEEEKEFQDMESQNKTGKESWSWTVGKGSPSINIEK